MSVYDLDNYKVLKDNGWKSRTRCAYQQIKKDDLIDTIYCLEHNWAGEMKANKLLSERLKKFSDYFNAIGQPDMFRKICMVDEERHQEDEWLECKTLDDRFFYMNMKTGEKLPYGVQPIKGRGVRNG